MIALLKELLPGSIPFLLIALMVCLILLQIPRTRRWGHRSLWSVFLVYLGCSMPVVSRLVAAPLAWGFAPLQSVEAGLGARAIVVLDGGVFRYDNRDSLLEFPNGQSVLRAFETARVYRLLGEPIVIVSGGNAMWNQNPAPTARALRDTLVRLGVSSEHIILDSNSQNTRAHALNVVRLLREQEISDFVLVTSSTHIRRSVATFRALGADPIPSPSAVSLDERLGWEGFWPSPRALLLTEQAMHDYFGLAYYRLRGWS